MFKGPVGSEPNDGLSPPGYPVVTDIDSGHYMSLGPPTGVTPEEWAAYARMVSWREGPAGVGLASIRDGAAKTAGGPA